MANPRGGRGGDLFESYTYPGFARLAMRHWRSGMAEMWRSFSKRSFVAALQRLIPETRSEHLMPAPAGVRAQTVARDGSMVDDFLIERSGYIGRKSRWQPPRLDDLT